MARTQGATIPTIPYQRSGSYAESGVWRLVLWSLVVWMGLHVLWNGIDIATSILLRWTSSNVTAGLIPTSVGSALFYAKLGSYVACIVLGAVGLAARRTPKAMRVLVLVAFAIDATVRLLSLGSYLAGAADGAAPAMMRVLLAGFHFSSQSIILIAFISVWPARLDELQSLVRGTAAVRIMMLVTGATATTYATVVLIFGSAMPLVSLTAWIAALTEILLLLGGSWIVICGVLYERWLRWAVWILLLLQLTQVLIYIADTLARSPELIRLEIGFSVVGFALFSLARTFVLVMFVDHLFVRQHNAQSASLVAE